MHTLETWAALLWKYPWSIPVLVTLLLGCVLLGRILYRRRRHGSRRPLPEIKKEPAKLKDLWKKQQGLWLFGCLLGGALVAYASYALGPYRAQVSNGGQLKEFRQINLGDHPVFEDIDVENYARITIFTETLEPPNGTATVTIYNDQGGGRRSQMRDIESTANAWSRWDTRNSGKRISIVASAPAQPGLVAATKLDILVYLSPK